MNKENNEMNIGEIKMEKSEENVLNNINLIEEEKIELRKLINYLKYEEDIYINQNDYDAFIDYQKSQE